MGRPDQVRGKAGAGMRMTPNCGKNVEISFCPYYTDTRMKNGTRVYGFFKWEQAPGLEACDRPYAFLSIRPEGRGIRRRRMRKSPS